MEYAITFEDAVKYIEAFVNHRELETVAREMALGGTILRQGIYGGIETLVKDTGNAGWYCLNDENSDFPKLFLSFEENDQYEEDRRLESPVKENLHCPVKASVFKYSGDGSTQDIFNLLSTHTDKREPISMNINQSEVLSFKTNFLNNSVFKKYMQVPYGFFENRNHPEVLELFVNNSNIVYIRYYFGFDENVDNKIRIILIGVDKQGKNIVPEIKSQVLLDDDKILENSWPPK
ncbi:hypothetical protein [Reichenbachiella ulvae]|uniref:Uncharacterized protein n=1 Tax=Reichenbachiella ulvae TaxID=2980104 RepID=A0ABT3CQU7_9BACT|nr:hypothetical protein [Reichenbachiella ulvae]MCV9385987.1 hypothetical protein [Reichenbachiella ulvae]